MDWLRNNKGGKIYTRLKDYKLQYKNKNGIWTDLYQYQYQYNNKNYYNVNQSNVNNQQYIAAPPLYIYNNTIRMQYNTQNLRETLGQLNTIQDIHPNANVVFRSGIYNFGLKINNNDVVLDNANIIFNSNTTQRWNITNGDSNLSINSYNDTYLVFNRFSDNITSYKSIIMPYNNFCEGLNADYIDGYHAASFALTSHNHDSSYAAINHNHDSSYAAIGHNHNDVYALLNHNHDSAYAVINHNHDSAYAAINHNHDSLYQPLDSDLTAIAGLTGAGTIRRNSDGTWGIYEHTQYRVAIGSNNKGLTDVDSLVFNMSPAFALQIGNSVSAGNSELRLMPPNSNISVIRLYRGESEIGAIYNLTTHSHLYLRGTNPSSGLVFQTGGSNARQFITSSGTICFSVAVYHSQSPRTQWHMYDSQSAGDVALTIGNAGNSSDTVPTASLVFRTRDISTDVGESAVIRCGRDANYADATNRSANLQFHVEISDTLTEIMRLTSSRTLTLSDNVNIVAGTSNGTKICTSTSQKLGFWNATPVVQPTTSISSATFTANSGTAINTASTFDGYTIGQVIRALRTIGLLA